MRRDVTPRWTTEAVELFLLTPDHVTEAYVGWLRDPEVGRFLESRFAEHDMASTRAFVGEMLDSDRNLFLGIRSRALGRHVGNIKLGPIDTRYRTAEIGLMIGDREAWGKGLATQAIGAVADIAAEELGLRKVTAGCYARNIGSERAFVRCGFAIEGRRVAQVICDGEPEDLVVMGKLLR
ncbi:MAG: GNAT family N-acetyltransferase [Sphingomonadaceae bacterium]|nr:GNAT family N-acetyltransferase [Sphingomonadaceae bacterium]